MKRSWFVNYIHAIYHFLTNNKILSKLQRKNRFTFPRVAPLGRHGRNPSRRCPRSSHRLPFLAATRASHRRPVRQQGWWRRGTPFLLRPVPPICLRDQVGVRRFPILALAVAARSGLFRPELVASTVLGVRVTLDMNRSCEIWKKQ